MNDERQYRLLKTTAIGLALVFSVWMLVDHFDNQDPRVNAYVVAERLFEDGDYAAALTAFEHIEQQYPADAAALRGKARSQMQLGKLEDALSTFNIAIKRAPDFAAGWANRGIVHDRLGLYNAAISDYERAAELDETTTEGPGWLTRFLRNQQRPQATILERAAYLRAELAKPESERLLQLPDADQQQRSYQP